MYPGYVSFIKKDPYEGKMGFQLCPHFNLVLNPTALTVVVSTSLLQEAGDVVSNVLSFEEPTVPSEWHTVRVDQELFKVPHHVGTQDRGPSNKMRIFHEQFRIVVWGREFLFEVHKNRCGLCSIDGNFLKDRECGNKTVSRS